MHFGANALETCFLAEGRLDGFLDVRGRIRVMDMAAGYLIAKQAGAVFSDETGRAAAARRYPSGRGSASWEAGNRTLHAMILAKLKAGG